MVKKETNNLLFLKFSFLSVNIFIKVMIKQNIQTKSVHKKVKKYGLSKRRL